MSALGDLYRLVRALGLYLAVLILHRIVFWFYFLPDSIKTVNAGQIAASWWLGLRFDLRMCCILFLIFLTLFGLLRVVARFFLSGKKWLLPVQMGVLFLGLNAFIWVLWVDFGHYAYTERRLNAMIFDFAIDPMVSLGMVVQSYPITFLLLSLALCYTIVFLALLRFVFCKPGHHHHRFTFFSAPRYGTKDAAIITLTMAGLIFGVYASFFQYLKTPHVYLLKDKFLAQFALNPLHNVVDTIRFKGSAHYQYDEEAMGRVKRELGIAETKNNLLVRSSRPSPIFATPPNIVVIQMETLGASRLGAYGNPLGATPNLDILIKDSLLFDNFHVPQLGTAQSMFSFFTGIPDAVTERAAFSNPLFIDQHILLNHLEGYKKFLFVGGKANWRNIQSMLTSNIDGLQYFSGQGFSQPAIDISGISDLDLFVNAHKKMASLDKNERFFVFIQTSSHHAPYTIYHAEGFESLAMSQKGQEDHGFNERTYNALRLLDHALGHFLNLAKKADYCKNTLFVLFGDHGAPHSKQVHLSSFYNNHDFITHHVPLIFHSPLLPKNLRAARNSTLGYLPDALPTLFSMIGVQVVNSGFGLDLRSKQALKRKGIFFRGNEDFPIKFFSGERIVYTGINENSFTQSYRTNSFIKQLRGEQGESFLNEREEDINDHITALARLGRAYFKTIKFKLPNNKKDQILKDQ